MGIRVINPVAAEPITMAEARLHLRVDAEGSPPSHPDDAMIELYLSAAREWAEAYLGMSVAQSEVELALDEFPNANITLTPQPVVIDPTQYKIDLQRSPVVSVTSIKYIDEDGIEQTLDPSLYTLDPYAIPPYVNPADGETWPATYDIQNAVKIRYTVGYTNTDDSPNDNPVPFKIKAAILLVLGHLYRNREDTANALQKLPLGATDLLNLCDRERVGFS